MLTLLFVNMTLQTFNVDSQVTDSASSASAMFSGIKTKQGVLGYDSQVGVSGHEVSTIMDWAQAAGKDTG